MDEPPIVLHWTSQIRDLRDAQLARRRTGLEIRIDWGVAAAFLVSAVLFVTAGRPLWAVGCVLLAAVSWFDLLSWVRILLLWRSNPYSGLPVEAVITDDGVVVSAEGLHSEYEWRAIVRWIETRRSFVLFMSRAWNSPGIMLAKRGVSAFDDIARLRTLLHERTADEGQDQGGVYPPA